MPIKLVNGRQIIDTSGIPTVEVDLVTELGLFRIAVPSTDVKKKAETLQLRDGNPKQYNGMSVVNAVKNINNIIAPELIKQNLEVTSQKEIDNFLIALDGTENLSRLGANAVLAVSLAVAKAGAAKKGVPLYRHISDLVTVSTVIIPVPHFTIFTGGIVSGNALPFQEYMIMPTGATSFSQALQIGTEIYNYVKDFVEKKFGKDSTYVGETGGFSIPINGHRDALMILTEMIRVCGYQNKVEIALNIAASDLFKDGSYDLEIKNPSSNPQDYVSSDKLQQMYSDNNKEFGVCSFQDGFDWDDWPAWSTIINSHVHYQVVADDLTQSNLKRIGMAAERKACNAITLRLNQNGTLTDLLESYKMAKAAGFGILLEDRWGETDDLFISDLAVGLACGQVKFGAPTRDRIGKYNQLCRIEEELGTLSKYAGKNYRGSIV